MKVLILGASGIIGQHMRLCVPEGVQAVWHRKTADRMHLGADLRDPLEVASFLNSIQPDVVVNLAGENNVDLVERGRPANIAVQRLCNWCGINGAKLVHVSTQAVFGGDEPPYGPDSPTRPVNAYGRQKLEAENIVRESDCEWVIVRPTFVLGVRPMPLVGRENPAEAMLAGKQPRQVADRWFSVLFADDAAGWLWYLVLHPKSRQIIHLGDGSYTRQMCADALGVKTEPANHVDFEIAERPFDTTYAEHQFRPCFGFESVKDAWGERISLSLAGRAREIGLFLGITEELAFSRLSEGFSFQHQAVGEEFKRKVPPNDLDATLDWYRTTESYIWELSAYHCDPGFNYLGMCKGIADHLEHIGAHDVLCLGDGIGDLTLALAKRGMNAVYHDLAGSRTAAFADFRFWLHHPDPVPQMLTYFWEPHILTCIEKYPDQYDAVVSLDFLEHVPNVPEWTQAIRRLLKPGGVMFAQNAFGLGSGPNGSIPCHLACNDRFEKDWTPLLADLNFQQVERSNWWVAA